MEETKEKKKRGPGRPRKERRGGRREGAGRKKGVSVGPYKDNPRTENTTFRVSEKTLLQIRQLREMTKGDEEDFNTMFVRWVDELATDYGIE